jgi:hypothetical protein
MFCFVTSDLDIRHTNAGFALAAFETATGYGVSNFAVDEVIAGQDDIYLVSWVVGARP